MRMSPLKRKIIREYRKMLKEYENGKTYNYDYILDMINLLDVYEYLKHPEYIEAQYLRL